MRKLLRLLWCAVALSGSLLAFSQDQTITGIVSDPKDNSPLAGAMIKDKQPHKAVQLIAGTAKTYAANLGIEGGDMGEAIHTGRSNCYIDFYKKTKN
jgi:hypothetical protein